MTIAYSLSKTYGLFARPEIDALMQAVRTLPKNPVAVILGASVGTATMSILEARPDIKVYTVDLDNCTIEKMHADRYGFSSRLAQIRGHSAKVGATWNKGAIDLLFVDACHTYLAVKADNKVWLPHLKKGGIAWYHDYGTDNNMWIEVKTAVDEDMRGQKQIARVCSSVAFQWQGV